MKFLLLLLATTFMGCHPKHPDKKIKKSTIAANKNPDCGYEKKTLRCKSLFSTYNQSKKMTAYNQLQTYFADSLLPCWYGTAWDYNGTAMSPLEGKIACGYFITTTLRQSGMKINRIKLAQCPSSELIWSVCTGIKIYSNKLRENSFETLFRSKLPPTNCNKQTFFCFVRELIYFIITIIRKKY